MKLTVIKSPLFLFFVLFCLAFAFIAPSIDWFGTPQLESLATKSANDFYLKLYTEKYHEIYIEADEELKEKTPENVFQNNLKTIKSKLTETPVSEQTRCIWTRTVSLWDRIKINSEYPVKIKSWCNLHSDKESFTGTFIWKYVNGELKLISFEEKDK